MSLFASRTLYERCDAPWEFRKLKRASGPETKISGVTYSVLTLVALLMLLAIK